MTRNSLRHCETKTVQEATREISHPSGREKRLVLGVVRQYGDQALPGG